MGANHNVNPAPPKPAKTHILPLVGISLCILFCALNWHELVEFIEGEPRLKPEQQKILEKKLEEIDDAEQYALVANDFGWYSCLHSGRSTFYLKPGEVWKYGVTFKGEKVRYTIQFLQANNVSYRIQFKGPISECLKEEQRKLFNYALLPENLARPEQDRLPRPPGNSVMR